jgi:transcriptional regulator with XRE-family HTH domain
MKELDFKAIGQRIREVRTQQKLTQEYVASIANVNVSHISNIETGKIGISLTLLVAVSNALNTTVDYLLQNEYNFPTSATEKELLNTIKDMEKTKQETLLKIAKVL